MSLSRPPLEDRRSRRRPALRHAHPPHSPAGWDRAPSLSPTDGMPARSARPPQPRRHWRESLPPDPLPPRATGEKSSLPADQPRKEPCPCARRAVPPRRSTAAPRTGRPTNLGIGRNGTPPPPLHPRHPNPIDPLHSDPDRCLRDAAAVTIPGPGIHHPIDDHRPAPAGALPARPTRPDPTAPSRQNRREPNQTRQHPAAPGPME